MAKLIPDDFIRDIIARTNIVDVISKRMKLKKKGFNYFGCCPFHNEKTPSFSVNEKKQFFYCFGCGASGSVIEFLKLSEHLTFPEAIEELAALYGINVPYLTTEGNNAPQISRNTRADIYQLMERVNQFYQHCLMQSVAKSAANYLSQRGLTAEIIKKYGIGFAPSGKSNTLNQLVNSKDLLTVYDQAGLLVTNSQGQQYDRFRGRIMFPIRDKQGHIVAFGGRVIDQSEPKYLNSPETVVFHKSRILYGLYEILEQRLSIDKLLVVEGYMDVVSLAQFGINYAVASLGTATTTEHIQMMFRSCDTVICCYDGDNAGRRAAWRTLTTALPILVDGQQLQFLFLPEGEDPDSLVRQEGKEKFEQRLAQAHPLSAFLFEHLTKQVELSTQEGRAKLSGLAVPLIEQVNATTLSILLKQQLASKLNINSDLEFNKLFSQKQTEVRADPIKLKRTTMRILIGLLVQYPELAKFVPHFDELASSKMAGITLFINLLKICHAYPNITTAQLLESYHNQPEKKQLETLAQWNHMYAEESVESNFLQSLRELYDSLLEQRLDELLAKDRTTHLTADEKKEVHEINLALLASKKLTSKKIVK